MAAAQIQQELALELHDVLWTYPARIIGVQIAALKLKQPKLG